MPLNTIYMILNATKKCFKFTLYVQSQKFPRKHFHIKFFTLISKKIIYVIVVQVTKEPNEVIDLFTLPMSSIRAFGFPVRKINGDAIYLNNSLFFIFKLFLRPRLDSLILTIVTLQYVSNSDLISGKLKNILYGSPPREQIMN